MDLLYPRATYHRANTDDILSITTPSDIELSPLKSKSSNLSRQDDEAQLLEYSSDYHLRSDVTEQTPAKRLRLPPLPAGWRTGAILAATFAIVSLIINVVAVAWLKSHPGTDPSLVTVFTGNCDRVHAADLWVHLAINALSTLLLAGSNYCMQCLCAPTRAEVDKSHARGRFLDIGVPSVRNLFAVSWFKIGLWWILGLSSVPLHLMYNSAFYASLTSVDYEMYFATQDFVDGKNFTVPPERTFGYHYTSGFARLVDPAHIQRDSPNFEHLDKAACISAYAQEFLSARRNLVLVSQNETTENPLMAIVAWTFTDTGISEGGASFKPYDWICWSDPDMSSRIGATSTDPSRIYPPCDAYLSKVESVADEWKPFGFAVEYCLSERIPETCSFNGNIPIVITVIVANAVKAVIMFMVAYGLRDSPLITIGDAVESFLRSPDETTRGLCLLTKASVKEYTRRFGSWRAANRNGSMIASVTRPRWSAAPSRARWAVTTSLTLLAVLVVGMLLMPAITSIEEADADFRDIGFGVLKAASTIHGWRIGSLADPAKQVLYSVLIANTPQAILSFLYLTLNGLLTTMFLAAEWSDFAYERKPLRVSTPKADQRSTHFLQLPYRIAIPLMILAGFLHWVVSQSIFLAVVSEYDSLGRLTEATAMATCGFSPYAMITAMVVATCAVVFSIALGFRRYNGEIPLVASCSAAISAACHPPVWDNDPHLKPVQWGVVPGSYGLKGVGHCCFSSGEVEPLKDGATYAGLSHH